MGLPTSAAAPSSPAHQTDLESVSEGKPTLCETMSGYQPLKFGSWDVEDGASTCCTYTSEPPTLSDAGSDGSTLDSPPSPALSAEGGEVPVRSFGHRRTFSIRERPSERTVPEPVEDCYTSIPLPGDLFSPSGKVAREEDCRSLPVAVKSLGHRRTFSVRQAPDLTVNLTREP